jgi:hypothetical protein
MGHNIKHNIAVLVRVLRGKLLEMDKQTFGHHEILL